MKINLFRMEVKQNHIVCFVVIGILRQKKNGVIPYLDRSNDQVQQLVQICLDWHQTIS